MPDLICSLFSSSSAEADKPSICASSATAVGGSRPDFISHILSFLLRSSSSTSWEACFSVLCLLAPAGARFLLSSGFSFLILFVDAAFLMRKGHCRSMSAPSDCSSGGSPSVDTLNIDEFRDMPERFDVEEFRDDARWSASEASEMLDIELDRNMQGLVWRTTAVSTEIFSRMLDSSDSSSTVCGSGNNVMETAYSTVRT